jgi:dienelactone hydrolase
MRHLASLWKTWAMALLAAAPLAGWGLTAGDLEMLRTVAGKLQGEYTRMQKEARAAVAANRGAAGCENHAAKAQKRAKEYAALARLSSQIYMNQESLPLKQDAVAERDILGADGRPMTIYRDPGSEGFAELHHEALAGARILVFRGSRISSLKDITTNLVQFSNVLPARYRWADELVEHVRLQFPGERLMLTGHSLGGGLAMYAGLRRGQEVVVFNPAGLSRGVVTELQLSATQWQAAAGRMTAFISRSGESVDPVSATSLAGKTLMAGLRYIVDLERGLTLLQQHEMDGLSARLAQATGEAFGCSQYLGIQRL